MFLGRLVPTAISVHAASRDRLGRRARRVSLVRRGLWAWPVCGEGQGLQATLAHLVCLGRRVLRGMPELPVFRVLLVLPVRMERRVRRVCGVFAVSPAKLAWA